ncbi:iron ABC transporter substrate-binding protein [Fervidicoccus fontis]|uniref:Iron ABC transporter substrate-binding protein n=1 Tax=Fervidicoccus fontis TaxID=683846 RepID=A0A843A7D0_9CREN|nr:iron ABC transporter substrate-binding protein [Fervidicoccus fontis]MBE9390693.1 iron ABC transporter substrate-binding protein [Fervidicoccus fontis]
MNVRTVVLTAVVLILIIAFCCEYFYTHNPSSAQEKVSLQRYVIDDAGRNVTLPANVSRVVAIGPGMLRLICYLNATDMLVGIEQSELQWGPTGRDYAMAYYDEFKNLTVIGPGGPGKAPNPELLLSVKPDLIIMSEIYCQFIDPDTLQREVNATVIVLDYGPAGYLDFKELNNSLTILGIALNREDRAKSLINYIQSIVDDLNNRTNNITMRPKVYVGAVSYKGAQPFTSTQSPFPPLSLLNTKSIADNYSNKTGFVSLDFEYLISEQPDVMFIDEGNLQLVKQSFESNPSPYLQLNAFRNGEVYGILPFNYYDTNIATALADAYYMGKILYPDRFKDINPAEKANEIFNEFLGKPLYQEYSAAYGGFKCLSNAFG